MSLAGDELPKNSRKYRRLDCAVFEYAYKVLEDAEPNSKVDTARVYTYQPMEPSGSGPVAGSPRTPISSSVSAILRTCWGPGSIIRPAWR